MARSQVVGLADLYGNIEAKLSLVPERDTTLRGVLEGILFRLHPLVQGQAARQYAAGLDAIDINAVVPGDWGIAILEGGKFLDDFSKAFLLGWAAWHFYNDAVIQRDELGVTGDARIQIVFEEANKILSGLDTGAEEETGGGVSVSEQLTNWWRDARKYGMWLHLITQSPSLIPFGILSSCNNMVVAQPEEPQGPGRHDRGAGPQREGVRGRAVAALPGLDAGGAGRGQAGLHDRPGAGGAGLHPAAAAGRAGALAGRDRGPAGGDRGVSERRGAEVQENRGAPAGRQ